MSCVENLLEIGSMSIVGTRPVIDSHCQELLGSVGPSLLAALSLKNGFFAFESALHVYPANGSYPGVELGRWNASALWRAKYDNLTSGCAFFASDVFGGQFCVADDEIYIFDPETGQRKWLAASLEAWADIVLGDFRYLTGYPLAHEWQVAYGPLPPEYRLVPRIPFVVGGEFEIENLRLADPVEAMTSRAPLALRIRNLPDGARIELDDVD